MKKSPYLFLFCALFMLGCNNDLDLTAPAKDIPVVYGIFSKLNTDHYVRIEKAFIDENIPAAELAIDSDNFIYDDLVVQVIVDGNLDAARTLERVDGNLEGVIRDEGFFDSDPNVLYKLGSYSLGSGQELELIIDRGSGFEEVKTSAQVVGDIELKLPNVVFDEKLDIRLDRETTVVFDADATARIFDVFITFHYTEVSGGGQPVNKAVKWDFVRNQDVQDTDFQTAKADGLTFYDLLLGSIEADPSVARRFDKFSIDIVGGGQAIRDFTALTQANTGITASQEVPNFSNLSPEGLGIFSSKFTFTLDSIGMSQGTITEFTTGEKLSSLNFE